MAILNAYNDYINKKNLNLALNNERWYLTKHTTISNTDAFGTIEFQGLKIKFIVYSMIFRWTSSV